MGNSLLAVRGINHKYIVVGGKENIMAVFQAFRALRPTAEKAAQVAALPYDVVSREEAALI